MPSHTESESRSLSKGVALVTGAGQGIGKAIALRLAADGFAVAVNDIASNADQLAQVVQQIEAQGCAALACIADVRVEDEVRELIAQVVAHFPTARLALMVANAGVVHYNLLVDTTTEDWDAVMAVNARGTFLCYKYAAIQMIKQGSGGRIIGASSVCGKTGTPSLGAYCASKFAIRGLTQAAAQELGKYGITVNAYAPGGINTSMCTCILNFDCHLHAHCAGTCHVKEPADIANIVSFLASEESQFITGMWLELSG
ncbi:hypothetical protein GGX14DRAFT_675821, partial [Mycena pura]